MTEMVIKSSLVLTEDEIKFLKSFVANMKSANTEVSKTDGIARKISFESIISNSQTED